SERRADPHISARAFDASRSTGCTAREAQSSASAILVGSSTSRGPLASPLAAARWSSPETLLRSRDWKNSRRRTKTPITPKINPYWSAGFAFVGSAVVAITIAIPATTKTPIKPNHFERPKPAMRRRLFGAPAQGNAPPLASAHEHQGGE